MSYAINVPYFKVWVRKEFNWSSKVPREFLHGLAVAVNVFLMITIISNYIYGF